MATVKKPAGDGKEKKKVKKDPNAPKKGLSGYMFFVKEMRTKVAAENPDMSFGDLGKELGRLWKEVVGDEKDKYERMAAKDKVRYTEEMKTYVPPAGMDVDSPKAKKVKSKKSPLKKEGVAVKEEAGPSKNLSVEFIESSDNEN